MLNASNSSSGIKYLSVLLSFWRKDTLPLENPIPALRVLTCSALKAEHEELSRRRGPDSVGRSPTDVPRLQGIRPPELFNSHRCHGATLPTHPKQGSFAIVNRATRKAFGAGVRMHRREALPPLVAVFFAALSLVGPRAAGLQVSPPSSSSSCALVPCRGVCPTLALLRVQVHARRTFGMASAVHATTAVCADCRT